MNRFKPSSVVRATLVALSPTLALVGCTEEPPAEKPVRPVLTAQVQIQPYWQHHTYSGEIGARHETDLGFRVAGKLAERDGIVTAVEAEQGQVVAAGQTVVRLALCCEKEAVISVPENRLDEMRGSEQVVTSLWAVPDSSYTGKVREISPGADPVTRTYRVRISLPEAGEEVQFGMTASVRVSRRLHDQVALLPATALFQQDGTPAVWVLDPDTLTVALRRVTVAEYRQNGVLVSDGVAEGERIVAAGVHMLVAGQRVRLPDQGDRP